MDELHKCREIGDAVNAMIQKEVVSVMQEDIDGIDRYLVQKWGVKISALPKWREFRERFYRRNIIVHNSAITNTTYRQKVGYAGRDMPLNVDEKYLKESVNMFQQAALKLVSHFKIACREV